jgi:hypothetical protein
VAYFHTLAVGTLHHFSAMSLPHTIELETLKSDVPYGLPTGAAVVKIAPSSPGASLTVPKAQASTRFAYFNQPEKHIELKYSSNVVITSKYSILSFFPKTLFEQFQRLANIFFLIVSGLQVFTDLSPTGRCAFTMWSMFPLAQSHTNLI